MLNMRGQDTKTKYVYILNPFFQGNLEGLDFRTILRTYNSLKEAYNALLKYLKNCKFQDIDITHLYKNCEDISRITATFNREKVKILVHFYEVY